MSEKRYSSNAERQRAYRERRKAQAAGEAPEITLTGKERHLVYLLTAHSRNRSRELLDLLAKLDHPNFHPKDVPDGQFPML